MVGIGVGLPGGLAALTTVITALTVSVGLTLTGMARRAGLRRGAGRVRPSRSGSQRDHHAGPRRPGHAGPRHARLRRGGPGRGLVPHAARRGRHRRALDARAGARRRGRVGRPAHAHLDGVRSPVRRGGGRVPDPGPQRLRLALGWCVGARHRAGAVRLRGGRLGLGVDAPPAPVPLLAQGDRSGPGRGADGGRGRRGRTVGHTAALLVALLLLAESFGRDVLWLWTRRRLGSAGERTAPGQVEEPGSLPERVR